MNIVTENPLDAGNLFEILQKQNSGSIIFHWASVKGRAAEKRSSGILVESSGDMSAELTEIESDIKNRWKINDILLVRRIGLLKVGDLISLVAVSESSSNDAFEACRDGLTRIKMMVSLKKTELFLE